MKNQQYLKIAGVLLLSALMLIPASAAVANTKKLTTMTTNLENFTGNMQPASRDTVWDNGADDGTGNGLSSQLDTVYPFNSQVADDFELTTAASITGVHWWGQFWNGAVYPNPVEFNILFYADDGTGNMPTGAGTQDPTSTALAVFNFPSVTGTSVGTDRYEYDVTLPSEFSAAAGTKYWIAIQAVCVFTNDGQWGWVANGANPDQLHVAVQGFPLLGTAYWTDLTYGDMAFYLVGGSAGDTTPPVTTCDITGTNPVTITLTATDDDSGVDYTKYKIDDGTYETYTAPVQVTEVGDHTVYYYSADLEGNIEDEQSQTFTVEAAAVEITIKGGLGVSATIKNTGATDLTDVAWSINLDGSLIFVGKTKSGTIASLAAGESVTVKDFVIGIGKTGIAVTAGTASASASGTVLLFLVIGVA